MVEYVTEAVLLGRAAAACLRKDAVGGGDLDRAHVGAAQHHRLLGPAAKVTAFGGLDRFDLRGDVRADHFEQLRVVDGADCPADAMRPFFDGVVALDDGAVVARQVRLPMKPTNCEKTSRPWSRRHPSPVPSRSSVARPGWV